MIFTPRDKYIRAIRFDPALGVPPMVIKSDVGIWFCSYLDRDGQRVHMLEIQAGDWIVRNEANEAVGVIDRFAMAALFKAA